MIVPVVQQVRQKMRDGIIPAVPVPKYANGTIHHSAQDRYARYLSGMNISGVAVWSHTGRGLFLSEDEREAVFKSWRAHLDSEKVIISGVGATYNRSIAYEERVKRWKSDALKMAASAKKLAADALLVFPPVIYDELPPNEREHCIIEYHRELSELGVPLIIFYLYEEGGGMTYSDAVLRQILSLPMTAGIKMASLDRVMTLQHVAMLLANEYSQHLFVTGEDRMFGYSFMRGAHCALMGLGAAFPNIQLDLIQSYRNHDYKKFMDLSSRMDAYAEATFTPPMDQYILRMLWCLVCAGVIPEEAAHDQAVHNKATYVMSAKEIENLRYTIEKNRLY